MVRKWCHMAGSRSKVDYDCIERGWRAGILSPRQLAAAYEEETGQKVSHAAIIKHFTKLGIPRNLAEKIKAKSDAMVTQAMVTEQVTPVTIKRDKDIIEDAATQLTNIRLGQRKDIQRSRSITMKLFDELEHQVGIENAENLEKLGELLRSEDDKGRGADFIVIKQFGKEHNFFGKENTYSKNEVSRLKNQGTINIGSKNARRRPKRLPGQPDIASEEDRKKQRELLREIEKIPNLMEMDKNCKLFVQFRSLLSYIEDEDDGE